MERVRLGVIGCGVIGNSHLTAATALAEKYQVVAVANLIPERVQAAAEKYKVPRTWKSGAELIAKDREVEMIVLAFPAAGRMALARKAFKRGLHVLTEKPVAMNAAQVRRLMAARDAASRSGCAITAGCCQSRYRFAPHTQVAAKFVASGALGELRMVRAREFRAAGTPPTKAPPTWRLIRAENGGGILMNWGCYDLDYLMTLTGWSLKPETVLAQTWTVPPQIQSHITPGSDAETYYAALIRCAGNVAISFERGEYMPIASEEAWQIIGTRGALRLKMTPGKEKKTVTFDEATADRGLVSKVIWEGEEGYGTAEPLLADFADAIRRNRKPQAALEEALLVQQISDAIYASAAKGAAVKVK